MAMNIPALRRPVRMTLTEMANITCHVSQLIDIIPDTNAK